MDLIDGGQLQAREHEFTVLQALATGSLTAKELTTQTRLPQSTLYRTIQRLGERGVLAKGAGGKWSVTAAGRLATSSQPVPGLDLVPALDAAIRQMPSEAQQAFLRLLTSAVVARHQLGHVYPSNWPGFVAVGLTGQGKTLIALIVARCFDLPDETVRLLSSETPGSLKGRREKVAGDWVFESSPLLAWPLLVLDEFDKAEPSLQKEAQMLLLGTTHETIEGCSVELRPVVMLALNSQLSRPEHLARILPDPFIRRSVVLCTEALSHLVKDIDLVARQIMQPGGAAATPPERTTEDSRGAGRGVLAAVARRAAGRPDRRWLASV